MRREVPQEFPNDGDFPGDFREFNGRAGIVLASGYNLTQANLFDAIRQRRTFARSSSYLSAMYTVNGQPMGSILPGMGPFELNLQATYAIPAGITATPRNICNIELWAASNRDVNGQFNRSTLKTWVNQPAQPSMERISRIHR